MQNRFPVFCRFSASQKDCLYSQKFQAMISMRMQAIYNALLWMWSGTSMSAKGAALYQPMAQPGAAIGTFKPKNQGLKVRPILKTLSLPDLWVGPSALKLF